MLVGDSQSADARSEAEQPAVQTDRLAAAKTAAASVLASVEACETAVNAGPSLDDLTNKASHARDSVQALSRSADGRLIPKATAAIALAEQGYFNSCIVWRAHEKAALASWKKRPVGGIEAYRHPTRYQDMWVQAAIDLRAARSALRDATP